MTTRTVVPQRCNTTGKISYRSVKAAIHAALQLSVEYGKPYRIYRPAGCHHLHLTTKRHGGRDHPHR